MTPPGFASRIPKPLRIYLVWTIDGRLGHKVDEKHVLRHRIGVALLLREAPTEPEFVVRMMVLPFE